jgi:hypothetical protein
MLQRCTKIHPVVLLPVETSPMHAVRRMREVAEIKGSDIRYDIDSGDGRFDVQAAKLPRKLCREAHIVPSGKSVKNGYALNQGGCQDAYLI